MDLKDVGVKLALAVLGSGAAFLVAWGKAQAGLKEAKEAIKNLKTQIDKEQKERDEKHEKALCSLKSDMDTRFNSLAEVLNDAIGTIKTNNDALDARSQKTASVLHEDMNARFKELALSHEKSAETQLGILRTINEVQRQSAERTSSVELELSRQIGDMRTDVAGKLGAISSDLQNLKK